MNDRRFILFLGKGGVGKTILSTAYANECAKQGKKTLLLSLYNSDKVSNIYGKAINDREITQLSNHLYTTTVTPESALEEYALLKLKVRFIYKAVFENRLVASFLDAIPGLNDLVMLGKAYWHVIEKEGETNRWDKVVVDAPATGHGIFFLQIPSVIADILNSGNMYEESLKMQRVLSDPEITELNLVTLPEEMPINESLEMIRTANEKLKLPISHLIANAVIPTLFRSSTARDLIERAPSPPLGSIGSSAPPLIVRLLEAARFRTQRQDNQATLLSELDVPIDAVIPFYFHRKIDLEIIDQIGGLLNAQLDDADRLTQNQSVTQGER